MLQERSLPCWRKFDTYLYFTLRASEWQLRCSQSQSQSDNLTFRDRKSIDLRSRVIWQVPRRRHGENSYTTVGLHRSVWENAWTHDTLANVTWSRESGFDPVAADQFSGLLFTLHCKLFCHQSLPVRFLVMWPVGPFNETFPLPLLIAISPQKPQRLGGKRNFMD